MAINWVQQIFEEQFQEQKMTLTTQPKILLYNDAIIALASGTKGKLRGCVVISGTGMIVAGYNQLPDGKVITKRCGGWGPLLGDEGSGYAFGFDILKAVCARLDGNGEQTSLVEGVFETLNIKNSTQLLAWVYSGTAWERISSLYPLAESHAKKGDAVAKRILEKGVNELCRAISTVVKALEFDQDQFPLVFSGGVLTHEGSVIAEQLKEKIGEHFPNIQVLFPEIKPEFAASLLAKGDQIVEILLK